MRSLATRYALATTPAEIVEVACLTALSSLGDAQVDTLPLNNAIVQENWSGGHSPNPTWSSVGSNGILLDLRRLDSIAVSSDGSVASVGSGARWGDVYAALDSHDAAVIGARLPTIGVGGSILGGGYHHLSNEFGLAADNAKNFEVVLSNGSLVNANSGEHSDLFWALKGGGPNFGVVTRYDLYTVPVHDAWVQMTVYAPDDAPRLLSAFDEWQRSQAADSKSNADLIISLDFVVLILVCSEPRAQPPAVFQPFSAVTPFQLAIPPTNLTLHQIMTILGSTASGTPARHDYRGHSSRIDTNLTQQVYSFWREKALQVRQATGASQTFVVQHVSQHLIDQASKNGGNALALARGPQQWWTTTIDWERAEDDDLVRSVSIEITRKWERLARERGLHLPFVFMNDASRDQSPLASYGLRNLQRLKQVSKLYDPSQMFQMLQNGGFLLSKS
ncbi:hypothetical protein C8A00DRAFT_14367 [Chaetomidium leptoderma]|uniref:FAD-binding PCMH-type domain-containing protein n=1 Tax=Chaetomidium leptoderma TaxID=669021 RepID=A0AAN6VMU4_9PEZI|nr:hypothetical protein C8A00DRAFT_14367 [Chaetomidium leptoderma]